jgi:hypothetical protein
MSSRRWLACVESEPKAKDFCEWIPLLHQLRAGTPGIP